jgi:hypothetical protein
VENYCEHLFLILIKKEIENELKRNETKQNKIIIEYTFYSKKNIKSRFNVKLIMKIRIKVIDFFVQLY